MPDLNIPAGGGSHQEAYLSVPPVGEGPWPGVVVLQDAFGMTDNLREHADHLAAAGYLAVAPRLYSARGAGPGCVAAVLKPMTSGQGPTFDDIEAACPVVASFGGKDKALAGHPERLEAALEKLGVEHDVKTYPDASHSFFERMPLVVRLAGFGQHQPSAEDAWRRILRFFDRHLR